MAKLYELGIKMIAIKGMEMPKRCEECKFCLRQETNDYGSFGECLLQKDKRVNCLVWSRDDDCPLVEIERQKGQKSIRYGVYEYKETNCTTYWVFSSIVFEEAERKGFVKVKEMDTEMEAIREARRLNALIAKRKGRH